MTVTGPGDDAKASDPDLIARTRTGDAEAYSILFERHREAAMRLARQMARGQSDADDLVAEAFVRVLQQLKEGKGPDVAFRAYLLTTLRHVHFRRHSAEKKTSPTDDLQVLDQPTNEADPVIAGFDNASASRAFGSLPERWQMILWHLEVEGQRPAEVAALLGIKSNAVSALAYRAREALRQAYLLQHLADADNNTCVAILDLLPGYVRGKLGRREKEKVTRHLAECPTCPVALAELREMNSRFSALIAPVVLGGAAAPYLASVAHSGAAAWLLHPWEWLQHWINFGPTKAIVIHKAIATGGALVVAGGLATGGVVAARSDLLTGTPTAPVAATSPTTTPSITPPTPTGPTPPAAPLPTTSVTPTDSVTPTATESTSVISTTDASATDTDTDTASASSSSSAATVVSPLRVSFTNSASGLTVTLAATATGGKGSRTFTWDLGDGSTATGSSVSHAYSGSGTYTVKVSATDGTRTASSSRSVSVYAVNEAPTAAFSSTVSDLTVSVDGSASSDPDGSIASYSWDFGDDSTGSGKSASHTYAAAGEYVVRLTVTDNRGTRASRVGTIDVE